MIFQLREARKEMLLGQFYQYPTLRTLLPVAKQLTATTCPRYFKSELETAGRSASLENETDETRYLS